MSSQSAMKHRSHSRLNNVNESFRGILGLLSNSIVNFRVMPAFLSNTALLGHGIYVWLLYEYLKIKEFHDHRNQNPEVRLFETEINRLERL